MNSFQPLIKNIVVIAVVLLCFFEAVGQENKLDKYYSLDTKKWFAELPLWVPGYRGTIAYGDVELTSSGSKEEKEREKLSSSLGIEFYFVGRINVQFKNNLFFQADAFSGKISSTFTFTPKYIGAPKEFANVTIQGTMPRFIAGYRAYSYSNSNHFKIDVVPYIGLRYMNLIINSSVTDSLFNSEQIPQRFEPVVGVYLPMSFKRFMLLTQVDYGRIDVHQSLVISGGC